MVFHFLRSQTAEKMNAAVSNPQFSRFLLVGAVNTTFGYGLFALLTWTGLPYPLAIGLATLGGIAFNFQTIGKLVFKGTKGPIGSRLWRFVCVYSVVYLINLCSVAGLLFSGVGIYLANGLMILPLAVLTYILQRKFVFTAP